MRPTNDQPTTNQATDRSTDQATESTSQPTNQRVTVPEAAMLLGLSEDAVRSRLKRGTLRKEKGRDGTVFVVLGPVRRYDQPTTSQSTDQAAGQSTGQDDLVQNLRDQVEFLREQLYEEREANRENRRIIAGLVQRVPELEPARESSSEQRESDLTASEEPAGASGGAHPVSQEPEQQHRSWLYRFFFGP